MVLLQNAMDLYIALEKEKDHGAAAVLAFKLATLVPELVQHAERLEQSVQQNIRHVVCKCEWCGNDFKVFHSELKLGKKSGRYCSRDCLDETRKAAKKPDALEVGE